MPNPKSEIQNPKLHSVDRRDFLRTMAAVGAGMTAACTGRKKEHLVSYHEPSDVQIPGQSTYYATTCRECPAGCGVWARTREGRTLKLEGNPNHPLSQGGLCARGQAAVQGLYNPDRVREPLGRDANGDLQPIDWGEATRRLEAALKGPIDAGRSDAVAWLTGETTDSDADLVKLLANATGMRAPVNLRLLAETPLARAAGSLFGYSGVPEFDLSKATLLVSLGADFLETWGNPVAQAAAFSKMHAFRGGARGRAVYAGPRQSNTAAACDQWLQLAPGVEAAALRLMIEAILAAQGVPAGAETAAAHKLLDALPLAEAEQALAGPVIGEMRALGGELASTAQPLVVVSGLGPDAELAQALALLATHLAGGTGSTVRYPAPARSPRGNAPEDVRHLLDDAGSGAIDVLLVLEANPAFLLPGKAAALDKVKFVACFTTQLDETALRADLVLPIHHWLESWGDHAAATGTVGILQPTMQVLSPERKKRPYGTRALADLLLGLSRDGFGRPPLAWQNSHEYLEARLEIYHRTAGGDQPLTTFKREAKQRGGIWTQPSYTQPSLRADAQLPRSTSPKPESTIENGLTAALFPHPYLCDGRGADKPWLQEVPETSTSVVWNSWAEIHPKTADALDIREGDAVGISRNEIEIEVPVWLTGQVMPGVVAVPIGQGHEHLGRWATGRGANPLRLVGASAAAGNLALAGFGVAHRVIRGGGSSLIRMAGSQNQERRELARASKPDENRIEGVHEHEEPSLYPEKIDRELHPKHDWSMVIDLDVCTGCGACVVACYAENNVPVVGPDRMREGREMAWLRIEKYVDGNHVRYLPNLCQHCHHAPCEPVCPVHATYHNDEGLNAMVYNRCVGTRYCSNNCVYKVRRFNFFDYTFDPPLDLQLNPDVSVRERGVMEKCTFCIQRIRAAKEKAKNEKRDVRDGEIVPACAQTCPAKAITFGNMNDPSSRVARLSHDPRAYRLLEDLGTRPSITYLKKVLRKAKDEG